VIVPLQAIFGPTPTKMILGQTFPYLRQKHALTGADESSAEVIYHDMIEASLEHQTLDSVHFFLEDSNCTQPSIDELRGRFGEARVVVKPLFEFPAVACRQEYVVGVKPRMIDTFARIRERETNTTYPLFTIAEYTAGPSCFLRQLSALLFAQPYDAMVVTSLAAQRVLESSLDAARDYLRSRLQVEVAGGPRTAIIPPGVNESFLQPEDRLFCRKLLALPEDAIILLYLTASRPGQRSDLEILLRVVSELVQQYPDLLLVAAGRNVNNLPDLAAGLGLGAKLRVISDFPFELKPFIYSAADVFVSLPVSVQQTNSLTILEAMACGLPVIAADWGPSRELVIDGETGFLIPTLWDDGAACHASNMMPVQSGFVEDYLAAHTPISPGALSAVIESLARNEGLRLELGACGRKRVAERYAWRVICRHLQVLWEDQWQTLRASRAQHAQIRVPNLDVAFRHFASGIIDHSLHVRKGTADEGLDSGAWRIPAWLRPEVARCLIDSAAQPLSVRELALIAPDIAPKTLAWLLKKGLLEFA
jgi:glycosyltransferase involved in cell wall biosynthesis